MLLISPGNWCRILRIHPGSDNRLHTPQQCEQGSNETKQQHPAHLSVPNRDPESTA